MPHAHSIRAQPLSNPQSSRAALLLRPGAGEAAAPPARRLGAIRPRIGPTPSRKTRIAAGAAATGRPRAGRIGKARNHGPPPCFGGKAAAR